MFIDVILKPTMGEIHNGAQLNIQGCINLVKVFIYFKVFCNYKVKLFCYYNS